MSLTNPELTLKGKAAHQNLDAWTKFYLGVVAIVKHILIVLGVITVLALIMNVTKDEKDEAPVVKSYDPRLIKEVKPIPVKETVVIPLSTLSFYKTRKTMLGMTDLQFSEFESSLTGKKVQWSGYVSEVRERTFGGYKVSIDMDDHTKMFSVPDISFDVDRITALYLKKGSRITFTGIITSARESVTSLQIRLEKVTITK